MTELCDIAFKYGTDKCPQVKHHFTEKYFEMFNERRFDIRKVVEMGIGQLGIANEKNVEWGSSLLMWREYLPNAVIFGADILPSLMVKLPQIITYVCDQTNEDDLVSLVYNTGIDIDIFIDDGLHTPESQIFTCKTIMPLLVNPVYIIEDAGGLKDLSELSEYDVEVWVPSRKRKYNDDRLVIVSHKWQK